MKKSGSTKAKIKLIFLLLNKKTVWNSYEHNCFFIIWIYLVIGIHILSSKQDKARRRKQTKTFC